MTRIEEKMEIADDSPDRESSDFEKAFAAADSFFSEKNIEQKTRIIHENKEGITEIKAFDTYLFSLGLPSDPVSLAVADDTMSLAISIDGKGRGEIIEIAHAINTQVNDAKLSEQVKKLGGL
jgi:hypothetical protein